MRRTRSRWASASSVSRAISVIAATSSAGRSRFSSESAQRVTSRMPIAEHQSSSSIALSAP